ncbi:MAG: helix-turn-helix transcriptional regulator [Bdellovibrio sp.]|nr:helix-turn-helix transcriptional regulator [Bdellovibrio sp.]
MEFISNLADVAGIIRDYLRKNKLKAKNFADLMNVKPSYLSRVLSKSENMSARTMIKLLNTMGYELVIMSKKDKNLFEQCAYAELYKDSKKYRDEVRSEVMTEFEEDLKKSLTNFFDRITTNTKTQSSSESREKVNE